MRTLIFLFISMLLAPAARAQDARIQLDVPVREMIEADETDSYQFDAGVDYLIRGSVNQISVDVVVRIVDPDGEELRSFDGPGRGPEAFQFETEAAGTYRIEVSGFENQTGDYVIELFQVEPIATDPAARVDQLLDPYAGSDTPGAAVAVFRDGKMLFEKAYGMADLALGVPFQVDTPTNIGSTSKQFTAFSILLLAEDGKLSLDDDVRKHIPELPDLGETVTIRHILTHTSGYREFLNLLIMSGRQLGRSDWIDRTELIEIVQRQPVLQNSPGSEWNYNNTAFGLAAVIVERVSGMTFPEFVKQRIFDPLDMTHSMVRPTPEHIVPGRSMGYVIGEGGTYLEKRDIGASVGAGGIYASVADLQKWVSNFTTHRVGTPEMIEQMTTRYVLATGDTTGYGLGLFVDEQRGLRRVQHGGADIAHRSMVAYFPEINAGLTTQSNNSAFDGNIAFQIAEAFFAEYMEAEPPEEADVVSAFDPATYAPEAFDDFVGRYALDAAPSFILTFFREEGTFFTQATGQSRVEIVPTSDSTFALTVVDASVVFHRDADGKVNGLTLRQNGEQHATRLADDDEVVDWTPTVAELERFTGRYFSEEVETFFTAAIVDSALVLQHRRMDDVRLTPGNEDTFASGTFSEVAFERDRNGRIIAFYLANGRTRNVRFARVE